jgi:septum formation protein
MLSDLGIPFRVMISEVDESCSERSAEAFALAVSAKKAKAVLEIAPEDSVVIACDTVVAYGDQILGKPADREEAKEMLRTLSGKEHRVISALCVANKEKTVQKASVTYVSFRKITDDELEAYVASGECDDKAGAYGIQGLGGRFITHISGDYYAIMGLPLNLVYEELKNIDLY